MDITFEKFKNSDKEEILSMMKIFYSSDVVSTNGSEEIFNTDFDMCIDDNEFLNGYTINKDNEIIGYSMISKSFSTEFGKYCVWLEDLYLKPLYRGLGIIPKFMNFIEKEQQNTILKLEVEDENAHAVHVYSKQGFKKLPYYVMKKEL